MSTTEIHSRWLALPANTKGALWMLAACFGFTCMAVLIKLLGQRLDSFQIVFFRCAVGLLVLLPIAWRAGGMQMLQTQVRHMHLARAAAGVTAMMCGFYAFTHLPLATATTITFSKPLFLIVLAMVFLGEVMRWRRWLATLMGFAGVIIMMRPWGGGLEPAMLVAVAQALAVAIAVLLVKKMPASEKTLTMLLYFALISTAVSIIPATLVWRWPTGMEWLLGIGVGVLGVTAQNCVVRAYRSGEATAVAPFDYSRLLFATGLGFLVFGELPDLWTWVGAGVIIASTGYIAQREVRLGRRAQRVAEATARAPDATAT